MPDIETLIASVRERPPLWNPLRTEDKVTIKKLWSEVAKNCNATEAEVKKKWKYLKDSFHMVSRKSKLRSSEISWKWHELLLFLKPTSQKKLRRIENDAHLEKVPQSDSTDTVCPTATISAVPSCRCNVAVADASNQCKEPEQLVSVGVQTLGDCHETALPYSSSSTAPISPVQCKCNVSRVNCNKPFEETLTNQERAKLELIRALSKQEEDRDTTYHFLMSLKDPINSLTVYEQMFVRLKFMEIVMHIIQNHCERQRTPSPS